MAGFSKKPPRVNESCDQCPKRERWALVDAKTVRCDSSLLLSCRSTKAKIAALLCKKRYLTTSKLSTLYLPFYSPERCSCELKSTHTNRIHLCCENDSYFRTWFDVSGLHSRRSAHQMKRNRDVIYPNVLNSAEFD